MILFRGGSRFNFEREPPLYPYSHLLLEKSMTETVAKKAPASYKQNIYIKGYLGLNSFDLNIDKEEMTYLIQEMKKDSKFVCEYLIQKGAKIVNQNRYNRASQNLIGKKDPSNDKFYTIRQIAEKTSVVGSTVMRWIQHGHLKGKKSGVKWLVEKTEFEKFMSKRNKETTDTSETKSSDKRTGVSTSVLLHVMQNKKIYQGVFSINEVWKNMESDYSFEQVNSALLNLSAVKKTKSNFIEKVTGRRGIFKLSDNANKLETQSEIQVENFEPNNEVQVEKTQIDNDVSEIKSAMRILKSMDENITVQKAKSILAERLCDIV